MPTIWRRFASRGIRGVTVLGDVLRPTAEGLPGGVDGQVGWLYLAVRHQVEAACGLSPTHLSATECRTLYGLLTAGRSPAKAASHWAACHEADLPRGPLRDLMEEHLAGRFCIGYELPPYLTRLLDAIGAPYLDIRIHPIRFLDDLLFAVRASDPRMSAPLAAWSVPRALASAGAGLHEAASRLQPRPSRGRPTMLVIGQRPADATQITRGRFFDAAEHRGGIRRLCASDVAILVKDHPSGDRHSLVTEVLAARPDAAFATASIYNLLADPGLCRVLTANSSVAYEAAFFGKPVTRLLPLPIRLAWAGERPGRGAHSALDYGVLTADFWRAVLAPYTSVTANDGCRLAPKSNRLRVSLDAFWGLEDRDRSALRQNPVSERIAAQEAMFAD